MQLFNNVLYIFDIYKINSTRYIRYAHLTIVDSYSLYNEGLPIGKAVGS